MSDAIALIGAPITPQEIAGWVTMHDFKNLLHTEFLSGVSASGDDLTADIICVPDVSMIEVCALVIYNAKTGLISPRFGTQIPAQGLSQDKDGLYLCLEGWCDEAPTLDQINPDCDMHEDPCKRYYRLSCKYERLSCGEGSVSVSFRDRSKTFNRWDQKALKELVDCAKVECEQKRNCGRTNQRRFGVYSPCRDYCRRY